MPVLTPARSGLARSGATRSGYPVLVGVRVPLYALAGVARSGATRSGYTSPQPFITIAGTHYGKGRATPGLKVLDGLTITDTLNEAPSTISCETWGFIPNEGDEIVVTIGSKNNLKREFGGRVLKTARVLDEDDTPEVIHGQISGIDYTPFLNGRKVTGHFTGSATTIATTLVTTYAATYSTLGIEADLPTVDGGITFTKQDLTDCLTQLARRVGADWKVDYLKVVYFGYDINRESAPALVNRVNPTFKQLESVARDISQFITRVVYEGGGAQALEQVSPGDTIIPVVTTTWYRPGGGLLKSGPQDTITYASLRAGGGGGLVGPGASPSSAPVVALANGSGIESGLHEWAVVFKTAAGKSLPGPRVSLALGPVSAPAAAPVAGTPTIGSGPNPGTHQYATTFKTPTGETTAGPTVSVDTEVTEAPSTTPTPTAVVGAGVDTGSHDYAVSYGTAVGETTPSPISGTVATGPVTSGGIADPSSAPTAGAPSSGNGPDPGDHVWAITFTNPAGETLPSPLSNTITTGDLDPPTDEPDLALSAGSGLSIGEYRYRTTFRNPVGETTVGPDTSPVTTLAAVNSPTSWGGSPTFTNQGTQALTVGAQYAWAYTFRRTADGAETSYMSTGGYSGATPAGQRAMAFPVSGFQATPAGCTRVLYRTGPSPDNTPKECASATVINIGGTDYLVDGQSDASRGQVVPAVNTAVLKAQIGLTSIPTGPTGTTQRSLYRTTAGGGTYKLVTTLADNTTTAYVDSTPDASLGAEPPVANTAYIRTVRVLNIPTGPSGTTGRKIYRTPVGSSQLKLVHTLGNNSDTHYDDAVPDASLGANAPTSNTTGTTVNYNQVSLTGIPVPTDPNVTTKYLYRRSGGAGPKRVATLATGATTYTDTTPNASLGAAALTASTAYLQRIPLTLPVSTSSLVTHVRIYGTAAGGAQLKYIGEVANGTTSYTVTTTDAGLGANVPISNTALGNQAALSSIPIGPTGTTEREIHRTAVGSSQLKLVTTIADNTTTAYTDSLPDGSLGANAPAVDTSGLGQPSGQVLPGATTLPITGVGAASASGGWIIIGNGQQVIRYAGVTSTSLTGIPPSGIGSITAAIGYNSTWTEAPALVGVPASGAGSIQFTIKRGDDVNLLAQAEDTTAQAVLAALIGGDGIREAYVQDRRLSYDEALARAQSHLDLHSEVEVQLTYVSQDVNNRAGAIVNFNLGTPTNVIGAFRIQQVTVSDFYPAVSPTYRVVASSNRYSFEQLLQLAGR